MKKIRVMIVDDHAMIRSGLKVLLANCQDIEVVAAAGDAEAALLKLNAANPLGRVGLPLDIANGVLYLASDLSAWVTGLELVIDGGSTL